LQYHDFKRLVRASGIFDSHRPLHFSLSGGSLRWAAALRHWQIVIDWQTEDAAEIARPIV
jgi:hypothetical protein